MTYSPAVHGLAPPDAGGWIVARAARQRAPQTAVARGRVGIAPGEAVLRCPSGPSPGLVAVA